MKFELRVDNIKCGGCASQITNKLSDLEGVSDVNVSVEQGMVEFSVAETELSLVKETLKNMGYPESGSQKGLEAFGSKAKSYVSCAIGRMSQDEQPSS